MMDTTEIKRVAGKARKSDGGTQWALVVYCPFCREPHAHGAGSALASKEGVDPGYFGHRAAHCGGGEYFVESASK